MKLPDPQRYALRLLPRSGYEVLFEDRTRVGFVQPSTLVCPKLYVVALSRDIHYVGVTNRPMASRINVGLRATGKHGYHGYKWKLVNKPLRLLVWSFPEQKGKPFLRQLETVEAEFAYQIRKRTGKWPLSQTEIHFYQATTAHLKAVAKIVAQCAVAGRSRTGHSTRSRVKRTPG